MNYFYQIMFNTTTIHVVYSPWGWTRTGKGVLK